MPANIICCVYDCFVRLYLPKHFYLVIIQSRPVNVIDELLLNRLNIVWADNTGGYSGYTYPSYVHI